MTVCKIKVAVQADIQTVWELVTSLKSYAWRSDISKIEVLSQNRFVEYTKDGYATTFTVTAYEPCSRWAFDMENSNMKGHWTGLFSSKNGETELDLTETVSAKKLLMKPFVRGYLKRQQQRYISDLQKALHQMSAE